MTGQATAPEKENFEWVVQQQLGIVKDQISDSATDQHSEQAEQQKTSGAVDRTPGAQDLPAPKTVTTQKSDQQAEAVITNLHRAEVDKDGVDIPG